MTFSVNIYRLYELNDEQFEQLVIQICIQVLGTGTFSFAPGKDGGRDGRFTGTAQSYPSKTAPISGKFVIQAKHTRKASASCSDADFTAIIKEEIRRIKSLIKSSELDHYLLFTNRKMTGLKDAKVRKLLGDVANLKTSDVLGEETIQSHLISRKEIWRDLGFETEGGPFRVNPEDLVTVIHNFRRTTAVKLNGFNSATNFTYVRKETKNRINKLSEDYYKYIQERSLSHFGRIKDFLEDPRNENLKDIYHDAADELKGKIITYRAQFSSFDEVLTYLYDEMVKDSAIKPGQKRLVKIFLHYMYFDCDIGQHA